MKGKITALLIAGLATGSEAAQLRTQNQEFTKILNILDVAGKEKLSVNHDLKVHDVHTTAYNKAHKTQTVDEDEFCDIEYSTESYLHDSGKEEVKPKHPIKKPVVVKPEVSQKSVYKPH